MSIITSARPAAPLSLTTAAKLFADAGNPNTPCLLTIPGSANLELKALVLTATGTVTPETANDLVVSLYGWANAPNQQPPASITAWTLIGSSPPEPVGGAGDPPSTQWLIQAPRMTYYLASGKLQGEFTSNVADHPQSLENFANFMVGLVKNIDPVMYFAIGASLATASPGSIASIATFYLSDGA
jgi:hypothetical protein